ncbi:hypothetical protein NPIL_92481 [Nephila pilipes]|uniref:Uncharacterized protein n=1 Tax=Nephila pilipes TaxID=299642 RepID=A0A8X6P9T7_NEPPI|nr:hypothetical protein NPIL_92481 [Nephila pilipes]
MAVIRHFSEVLCVLRYTSPLRILYFHPATGGVGGDRQKLRDLSRRKKFSRACAESALVDVKLRNLENDFRFSFFPVRMTFPPRTLVCESFVRR